MSFLDPAETNEEVEASGVREARKIFNARNLLVALGAISLVGLGAAGLYWSIKQKPEWFGIKNESQAESQAEVQSLVEEVEKIIALPEGETPTIATVTDLEKVKDQQFFKNAQNGDKVLVYTAAKKAFLYRPTDKKIIEVGVVNINQQQGEVAGENQNIEVLSPSPTTTGQPSATITGRISVTPTEALKSSPTPQP